MLSALLNTGASENTNIVGVTSSQIALKVLEIEKGVGDTLTKLKRERLALVDQLKLSQVEDERAQPPILGCIKNIFKNLIVRFRSL